MKEFIKNTIHQKIEIIPYKEIKKFPLVLQVNYEFYQMKLMHQVYIPFLGLLLKQNEARALKPCFKISFLTQKFLLLALYEEWDDLTVTVAADNGCFKNVSHESI